MAAAACTLAATITAFVAHTAAIAVDYATTTRILFASAASSESHSWALADIAVSASTAWASAASSFPTG